MKTIKTTLTEEEKAQVRTKMFWAGHSRQSFLVLSDSLSVSFKIFDTIHDITSIIFERLSVERGIEVVKVAYAITDKEAVSVIEKYLQT
ncbi:MAG: hypothetical protein GY797_24850 [Deltaproteobacteria bacterium]|nr:hypothetical protein [Deltaproteobacteria bacterium]